MSIPSFLLIGGAVGETGFGFGDGGGGDGDCDGGGAGGGVCGGGMVIPLVILAPGGAIIPSVIWVPIPATTVCEVCVTWGFDVETGIWLESSLFLLNIPKIPISSLW